MDKQAFKQRMQNLKSYREQNPGKGYWEWKVQAFEDGGEFTRKTRGELMQEAIVDGKLDSNKASYNQNEYQKDFAKYWYTERAKNPKYADQIGGDKLKDVLSNVDKATWKTPVEAMRDNLIERKWQDTSNPYVNMQVQVLKQEGVRGFANPKSHSYSTFRPTSSWHEGIGHMVGDNTPSILQANPNNIIISDPDSSYEEYANRPNEKHAQTWDFRGNNSNLVDDEGKYYIDPNRQLTPQDIKDMRSKGARMPEQWEELDDNSISELTNTFAYNLYNNPIQYMEEGGEVGDDFVAKTNKKLGRTPDGRPIEEPLKPAFDLRDFTDFTPVGDALAVKDTYDAAKNKDWLGVGLSALSILPFIPGRSVRKASKPLQREIGTVNKHATQDAINAMDRNERKILEEYANQRNRAYELLNTPEARRRAKNIDEQYGTEYAKVYDELTKQYEDIEQYVNLPDPDFQLLPDKNAIVYPSVSDQIILSKKNIKNPASMDDGLIRHEIGHIVDEKAYPGGIPNNNYLRHLGKPSKYRDFEEIKYIFDDPVQGEKTYKYLRQPTEKKSFMNQFDEYLMNTKTPQTYPTTLKEFIKAIEEAPDTQRHMKILLKMHQKPSILWKDFKNRPLVDNTTKAGEFDKQLA